MRKVMILCAFMICFFSFSARVKADGNSEDTTWQTISVSHEWSPGAGKKEVRFYATKRSMELTLVTDGFRDRYSVEGDKSCAVWKVSFQDGKNKYKLLCRTPNAPGESYAMEDMVSQIQRETSSNGTVSCRVGQSCTHETYGQELKWSVVLPDSWEDFEVDHIVISSYLVQECHDNGILPVKVDWSLDANGVLTIRDAEVNHSLQELYQKRALVKSIDLDVTSLLIFRDMFADFENLETVTMKAENLLGNDLSGLFRNCRKLRSVDLGGLSGVGVNYMVRAFQNCSSLETIVSPVHLSVNCSLDTGEGVWQIAGSDEVITVLPKDVSEPVVLQWKEVPLQGEIVQFAGANLNLGNSLAMNFYFEKKGLDPDKNYYVQMTKTYEDGTTDGVRIIPQEEWNEYNVDLYKVICSDIAAKEMNDEIYVQVFEEGGKAVSEVWEDSIAAYVTRRLEKEDAYVKTAMVDMLNYGAASQIALGYDITHLANAWLNDTQKGYATQDDIVCENHQPEEGLNYVGSNLNLGNNLSINMYFKNVTKNMHAIVEFVDHMGVERSVRIEGSEFIDFGGGTYKICVKALAVADVKNLLACKVLDENDVVVAYKSDSIESYIARKGDGSDIYATIMRFGASAYKNFHQ